MRENFRTTKLDNRKRNIRQSGHHRPYKFINGCPLSRMCLVHMFFLSGDKGAASLRDCTKSLDGFMGRNAGIR